MTRTWNRSTPDTAVIEIAAAAHLLVALDFDGTAAPLVHDPMSARAIPEVAEQVERLAALPETTVAYVSGRSLVHLREIAEHGDNSPIALAGSHGAQYWFPGEGERPVTESADDAALRLRVFAEVGELLHQHPGIRLEEKTFGVGVHGRGTAPEDEARAFAAVDELMNRIAPTWRRRTGDRIVEFSSQHAGKDAAIAELRDHYGASAVLFIGDDVTDEDALRTLHTPDLGVRVGPGDTAATLRVADPREVAELLSLLADERSRTRE